MRSSSSSSTNGHKTPKSSPSVGLDAVNSRPKSVKKKMRDNDDHFGEDEKIELSRKLKLFKDSVSTSQLTELPLNLLQRIFFSGYLTISYILRTLPKINKLFHKISRQSCYLLDIRSRDLISHSFFEVASHYSSSSLYYIDLSYCTLPEYFDGNNLALHLLESLKGFSLRGTIASDSILPTIAKMKSLQFLDLSKSKLTELSSVTNTSSSGNQIITFTNNGLKQLKNLKNLIWLNLSCTHIEDNTLQEIIENNNNLEHIALFGCASLTNGISKSLVHIKSNLKSLDISHCPQISDVFFIDFLTIKNTMASTDNFNSSSNKTLLENDKSGGDKDRETELLYLPSPCMVQLLKCSYLPLVTESDQMSLIFENSLPNLRYIEALYTVSYSNLTTYTIFILY